MISDIADVEPWKLIVVAVLTAFVLVAVGSALIWAIIKVHLSPPPAMLTVTLGILTLVSILAFTLTGKDVLGTLAATGLGALAGSLTTIFGTKTKEAEPIPIEEASTTVVETPVDEIYEHREGGM